MGVCNLDKILRVFNSESHLNSLWLLSQHSDLSERVPLASHEHAFVGRTAAHALTMLHLFKRGRHLIAKHRLTEEPLRAVYKRKGTGVSFNKFWKSKRACPFSRFYS